MAKLVFPPEIENVTLHPSFIQFDIYDRGSTTESALTDQIVLFMPDECATPNTVSWDSDSYKSILGQVGGIGEMLKYTTGPAATIGQYKTGLTANPFVIMMFKGVDLRRFTLTFILSPRSYNESVVIDKLVRTLRGAALPPGTMNDVNIMYGYPSEFEITHMFENKPNRFLPKFARSVLTAIDVNNMDTGQYSIFRTGAPVKTKITLQFTELKVVLREDVTENGY